MAGRVWKSCALCTALSCRKSRKPNRTHVAVATKEQNLRRSCVQTNAALAGCTTFWCVQNTGSGVCTTPVCTNPVLLPRGAGKNCHLSARLRFNLYLNRISLRMIYTNGISRTGRRVIVGNARSGSACETRQDPRRLTGLR